MSRADATFKCDTCGVRTHWQKTHHCKANPAPPPRRIGPRREGKPDPKCDACEGSGSYDVPGGVCDCPCKCWSPSPKAEQGVKYDCVHCNDDGCPECIAGCGQCPPCKGRMTGPCLYILKAETREDEGMGAVAVAAVRAREAAKLDQKACRDALALAVEALESTPMHKTGPCFHPRCLICAAISTCRAALKGGGK